MIKNKMDKELVSRSAILILLILVIVLSVIGTLSILLSLPSTSNIPTSQSKKTSSFSVGEITMELIEPPAVSQDKAFVSLTILEK